MPARSATVRSNRPNAPVSFPPINGRPEYGLQPKQGPTGRKRSPDANWRGAVLKQINPINPVPETRLRSRPRPPDRPEPSPNRRFAETRARQRPADSFGAGG